MAEQVKCKTLAASSYLCFVVSSRIPVQSQRPLLPKEVTELWTSARTASIWDSTFSILLPKPKASPSHWTMFFTRWEVGNGKRPRSQTRS